MAAEVTLIGLRFGRGRGQMPPVGLLYLGASLDSAGITWDLCDCQLDTRINAFAVDALVSRLRAIDSPVLAFSVFNDALPLMIAALEDMAPELRGRRVIIGGPGVVGVADALMARLPQIDAVVVGEGETALPILVGGDAGRVCVAGVWTRDDNGHAHGGGRTSRESLNRFRALPWERCRNLGYSRIALSTMRGCPFDCEFCEIIAFMGRKVTTRDIDLAMADLDGAQAVIDSDEVDVLDDTLTLNRHRVRAFAAALAQRARPIRFSVYSRIDTIDRPTLAALRDAGCRRIFFGIDGADPEVLTRIHKRIQPDQALRVLREAAEFCDVTASLIWGYPFETLRAFEATMAFAETCLAYEGPFRIQPQLHLLSPSAGTPLFDAYGRALRLDESVEGSTVGTLGMNAFRRDYDRILSIIRSDQLLGAPFYRYESPDFAIKARRMSAFTRQLDIRIGQGANALLAESSHVVQSFVH